MIFLSIEENKSVFVKVVTLFLGPVNTFELSLAFHKETSHSICRANRGTA